MDKDKVIEKLRKEDRQVTRERKYFIDLCENAGGHFTAADLLDLDSENDDTLSRATVYNCLKVFLSIGYLRKLPDLDSTDYYEVRRSLHPHATCRECGRIIDIPFDLKEEVETWELPFQLEQVNMSLVGLCERCYSSSATG